MTQVAALPCRHHAAAARFAAPSEIDCRSTGPWLPRDGGSAPGKVGFWTRRRTFAIALILLALYTLVSFPKATMATSARSVRQKDHRSRPRIPIAEHIRGKAGLFTTRSLCRMTRWIYRGRKRKTSLANRECTADAWLGMRESGERPSEKLRNASHVEEHDTIYVPHTALTQFVDEVLPRLAVRVVVISGQTTNVEPGPATAVGTLLDHPLVARWFCQNLPKYGGGRADHPKVRPFPYGLLDLEWYMNPKTFHDYKRVFFDSLTAPATAAKTELIFAGPLRNSTRGRADVPAAGLYRNARQGMMAPAKYYARMAQARYIVSPNGDRPECYRHYQAIGLGTMPLTELDPVLFHHFGANVVFNVSDWNVTALEERLDPAPVVNRNLIREAYWMEWANGMAGASLNWGNYTNGNGLTEEETAMLASMESNESDP